MKTSPDFVSPSSYVGSEAEPVNCLGPSGIQPQQASTVVLATTDGQATRWEEFVRAHPECTSYHQWNWKGVIEKSFGWSTFYLMAEDRAQVRGILPLVWQKSRIFGSFVTSMPFLNAGGIVAEDEFSRRALLDEAIRIASKCKAQYVELRHRQNLGLDLPQKTSKVTVVLPLRAEDQMWKALDTKIRTKVRKSLSFELKAEFGGKDFLDDFYTIFAENMRDLGTPVYAKNFFFNILEAFPRDVHICVVRKGDSPVAASFLIGHRDRIEAVWSSSIRKYLPLKPNMFLYWNLFCFAAGQGYKLFDFGRSTVGSGTHDFKLQWGAQTVPLYWDYWLPEGDSLPGLNTENPKYKWAIRAWQKLPVQLTRLLGPHIVRCLP
jgi:FemAB-related protein (PEP-CTERM system-associated)